MAGYSSRSLVDKLGIKEGWRIAILNAPAGYARTLGTLPAGLRRTPRPRGPLDFVQFFTHERRALERRFPTLGRALAPAGMLWVSWPQRASGVATDLTEDGARTIGLAHGLVDVKVASVGAGRSGLDFMRRSPVRHPR